MANFIDKIRIKVAANKPRKFKLDSMHLTSQNFNQHAPIYCKTLVPNSKFNMKLSSFARLQPMPQPTFMSTAIYNRAFFAPFRCVWEPWNSFITNVPHNTGLGLSQITEVPSVSLYDLASLFAPMSNSTTPTSNRYATVVTSATAAYDICVPENSTTSFFWTLTPLGRHMMRILESLGYKLDFSILSYSIKHATYYVQRKVSALPLLCYAKTLFDWFFPGQYINFYQQIIDVCKLFNKHDTFTLNTQELTEIFDFCSLYFAESSYFVNAFDNPDSANAGTSVDQTFNLAEPYSDFGHANAPNNVFKGVTGGQQVGGNPEQPRSVAMHSGDNLNNTIDPIKTPEYQPSTQYGTSWQVSALSRLSAWLKRHQLAGAKVIDRYLARYGVQLSEEKSNRTYYLGSDKFYIQFGDVMSTAGSSNNALGDYAGKGIAFSDKGDFSVQTDEFGVFIVVNTCVPDTAFTQGIDRDLYNLHLLDYYTPEFDGLGCQPISLSEIWNPRSYFDYQLNSSLINGTGTLHPENLTNFGQKLFGFTPRYSSFKLSRDLVTGNFSNPSTEIGLQAWTNTRYVRPYNTSTGKIDLDILRHSPSFMVDDGKQYDRIYYQTQQDIDGINFSHYFSCEYYAPMLPLYDSFEFENEQNKDAVKINSQGSKL